MRRYHKRNNWNRTVPKALMEEVTKVNSGFGKGNVLSSLITKDVSGRKVGFNQAKRGKGVVALGPTTLTPGTYQRYQRVAGKLGMRMADIWRVAMHTMLPVFETAAEKMPEEQPAAEEGGGCKHCGK